MILGDVEVKAKRSLFGLRDSIRRIQVDGSDFFLTTFNQVGLVLWTLDNIFEGPLISRHYENIQIYLGLELGLG